MLKVRVKQEVKELCVRLIEACQSNNTEEFKKVEDTLKNKWKFNTWNLLALFGNIRTIEVNPENYSLVMEAEGK